VSQLKNRNSAHSPQIWAIGGGKGGVGKSMVSILLASALAQQGQKTILIDTDLGGANLHTMMGIKTPVRTLNDFITRKYHSLDEICIQTTEKNLQLICGASEILSLANPQYAQKNKIVQGLIALPADQVILDLGAGTSYNVLDFFLIADHPIVVVTPQPISIQNAYGFVRNTIYRKLSRLAGQQSSLQNLIKTAMDPKNDSQMRTIHDLFDAISNEFGTQMANKIKEAVFSIRPWLITNIAREKRDRNAGRIIQLVAEKYLTIRAEELGAIYYDPMVEKIVSQMRPVSMLPPESTSRRDANKIVQRLLNSR
jgi:flagellar biosynthesis protein FlhG